MGNKKFLENDFKQGLIWNYISILFLAVGGVAFSFLIGFFYNAETLGNFNLIYAYYIVLSQIGVWGNHAAVTKYVSEYAEDSRMTNTILSSGLLVVCVWGIGLGGLIWIFCKFIFYKVFQEVLLNSVGPVIFSIFFFSLNKVVLGYLNGLSKMKEYAVLQSLRNILIVVWILIFAFMRASGDRLPWCFAYTEIIIFFLEMPLIIFREKFRFSPSVDWIRKTIKFGTHIMPANIVLELSTKVDLLCLSWVLKNEKMIGIYSFATLFSDGFYQLYIVVRRSINPLITQKYKKNELTEFYANVVQIIRKRGYLLGAVGALLIVSGYFVLCFILGGAEYYQGTIPLVIILLSIICNTKGIVLGNILAQTGNPMSESINNVLTVMSNFILNILFIMRWGMIGAAFATGISYFVFSLNQTIIVKKRIGLN